MQPGLLIYGATGFTGRLIVDEALAFGIQPIVSGRSATKLGELARSQRLRARCADLRNPPDDLLEGVGVVINAAGPFAQTAEPLARLCLERGVHYLDISGEIRSLQRLTELDGPAARAGVMLMPAVGFDVVPTDCMAAWVTQQLPAASELDIALSGLDAISRGSANSVFEQYADLVTVRRNGRLTRVAPGSLERSFDFGSGPVPTTAITWGDVVSAFYSTGVPNITVYYESTAIVRLGLQLNRYLGPLLNTPPARFWQTAATQALPAGPSATQRARGRARAVVQARNAQGQCAEVRLETPEVYSFTATTAIAVADQVLHGVLQPGYQTPARVFGSQFVLSLPGVTQSSRQPRPAASRGGPGA